MLPKCFSGGPIAFPIMSHIGALVLSVCVPTDNPTLTHSFYLTSF